jgi:protein-S-isoprenylcysteine O-methyltransferase Ste14
MQKLSRFWSNRGREYPAPVYWALFIGLWALAIATAAAVYVQRLQLAAWKLGLFAALLGGYLLAEKIAHRPAGQAGQRVREPLRYWLALTWWVLILGSVLVYALWPVEQATVTAAGAGLMVAGSALRVWSVHTLGRFYSGHIETWSGQRVVSAGPYRVLRHPGYAGNILQVVGLPLVVNAHALLALAVVVVALFVRRLLWEEAWLRRHLPGYEAYCRRTWRLVPGVW